MIGMKKRSSKLTVILITFALTLIAVLVVLNFTGGEKKLEHRIPRLYAVGDPQFYRTMGVLLGPAIVDGNRFEVLLNGDQIFPAMLSAIRSAQRSITFETYIYWSGAIGKEFADALAERARAGVKVHVLLDWVGSDKMDKAYLEEMARAGVELRRYHEPHWYNLSRLNNRTHRKLLIVDGKVGFTGGVGIADEWTGNAQDPEPLARHSLQGRGTGRRADAGGVRGQLDQDHRRSAAWRCVLSGAEPGRYRQSADVQQLTDGRQQRACI